MNGKNVMNGCSGCAHRRNIGVLVYCQKAPSHGATTEQTAISTWLAAPGRQPLFDAGCPGYAAPCSCASLRAQGVGAYCSRCRPTTAEVKRDDGERSWTAMRKQQKRQEAISGLYIGEPVMCSAPTPSEPALDPVRIRSLYRAHAGLLPVPDIADEQRRTSPAEAAIFERGGYVSSACEDAGCELPRGHAGMHKGNHFAEDERPTPAAMLGGAVENLRKARESIVRVLESTDRQSVAWLHLSSALACVDSGEAHIATARREADAQKSQK